MLAPVGGGGHVYTSPFEPHLKGETVVLAKGDALVDKGGKYANLANSLQRRGGDQPMTESSKAGVPGTVRMRQGMPTRVRVGGERYRFGINTWRADEQMVHFTVLHSGETTSFRVREGDHVDAIGHHWVVSELQIPESGKVVVQLDQVAS